MDRNSIIGLLLIGLILIGFSIWNQPSADELATRQRVEDSLAAVASKVKAEQDAARASAQRTSQEQVTDTLVLSDSAKTAALVNKFGAFASGAEGSEKFYTLENKLIKVTFSNKGGKVHSVELKNYKTFDHKPLKLFESDTSIFGLNFFAQNRDISTNNLFFSANQVKPGTISFKLNTTEGPGFLEYLYSLPEDGYLLDYSINISNLDRVIASNISYLELDWKQNIYTKEKNVEAEQSNSTIYYKFPDDEAEYLSETSDDKENLTTKVKWVSFKQQYFNTTLIAKNTFDKPTKIETIHPEGHDSLAKYMQASFTIPYSHKPYESFDMSFYFGPNHYQTLRKMNLGMEKLVPLGWGIFGWVNRFIVIPIFNFLNRFDLNYGIIILILTIAIKLLLLPLTYKAYLSTAKMKVLKPEMDEIQGKNKEDPMKAQQELMAMYRKAGVNPLGGCLPMLLQMPILIAMFRFFPASIELRQESFLWADDLSTYDSILNLPFTIPFYGDHVSLFTILMTISTIMYTYLNSQMTATNPQMKWVMYLMPVMFLGIFNNYSAGLSYYYFLANIISFGQQFLFRAAVDEKAIHAKIRNIRKSLSRKPSLNSSSAWNRWQGNVVCNQNDNIMNWLWNKNFLLIPFQLVLVILISCTGSKPVVENFSDFPGEPSDSLVAYLERTRCFGVCPYYSIRIYRSGYVMYEGYEHVPNTGRYYTWLTKAQLTALGQKAESLGYFELENEYRNPHLTDFPTIYSEVRFRGKRKKITHYTAAPPKALVEMEKYIDNLFPPETKWMLHPVQEIKE